MRRSLKVAVILFAIAATALALYAFRARDPSYQGKSLERWLQTSENIPPEVIKAMGPDCIPVALRVLSTEPPKPSRWFNWGLLKRWHDSRVERLERMRMRTLDVFATLGTNGLSAIPELVKIVQTHSHYMSQVAAASCLVVMGEPGMNALLPWLQHTNAATRAMAAGACYRVSGHTEMTKAHDTLAKMATPHLLNCATNGGIPAALALRTLEELNLKIDWIVPLLPGILSHPTITNDRVNLRFAFQTVRRFGPRAAAASNAVAQFLSHPDRNIAADATNTLRRLRDQP